MTVPRVSFFVICSVLGCGGVVRGGGGGSGVGRLCGGYCRVTCLGQNRTVIFVCFSYLQMPCKQEGTTVPDCSLENFDIEGCVKTIEGLLQRSISDDDGSALEVMLVNVLEERQRRQQDHLTNKYGIVNMVDVNVFNVDDSRETRSSVVQLFLQVGRKMGENKSLSFTKMKSCSAYTTP